MHGPRGSDEGSSDLPAARRGSRCGNVATLLVSLLLSFLIIEIGYRAAAGLPLFKLANWRVDRIVIVNLGEVMGIADPVLGWTTRPFSQHEDGYTTIDYGIRKNFGETTIRTGGMLAVGDSLTEGWEVKDSESWPALLEKITNVPVINAGVGGYGADQSILRAEQLLPIVKPKILIVVIHESTITRVGYSVYGAPKPYFTIEKGKPRYHPPKLTVSGQETTLLRSAAYEVREILGYSAPLNYIMARLNPNLWHGVNGNDLYSKTDVGESAVTCGLLHRLKEQTDRDGVHLVLFVQYHAPVIDPTNMVSPNTRNVAACAQWSGIRVVDQFVALRAIAHEGPDRNAIRDYYLYHDGIVGHMTVKGNAHAANLIAPALRDWLPEIPGWTSRSHAAPAIPTASDAPAISQP